MPQARPSPGAFKAAPPEVLKAEARRIWALQADLPLLPGHPEALKTLKPAQGEPRLVAQSVWHDMKLTWPAGGTRSGQMVWLLPQAEPAVRALWQAHLKTTGWHTAEGDLPARVTHPERGQLTWRIHGFRGQPTRLEATLTQTGQPPAPVPVGLKRRMPPYLRSLKPLGIEVGHHHNRQAGARFSDVERVAVAVRLPREGVDALLAPARQHLEFEGFTVDDDDPTLLRNTDGRVLTWRIDAKRAPGVVVLHHQRRWKQPWPTPEERKSALSP